MYVGTNSFVTPAVRTLPLIEQAVVYYNYPNKPTHFHDWGVVLPRKIGTRLSFHLEAVLWCQYCETKVALPFSHPTGLIRHCITIQRITVFPAKYLQMTLECTKGNAVCHWGKRHWFCVIHTAWAKLGQKLIQQDKQECVTNTIRMSVTIKTYFKSSLCELTNVQEWTLTWAPWVHMRIIF